MQKYNIINYDIFTILCDISPILLLLSSKESLAIFNKIKLWSPLQIYKNCLIDSKSYILIELVPKEWTIDDWSELDWFELKLNVK